MLGGINVITVIICDHAMALSIPRLGERMLRPATRCISDRCDRKFGHKCHLVGSKASRK
jgi:hypothetical protein